VATFAGASVFLLFAISHLLSADVGGSDTQAEDVRPRAVHRRRSEAKAGRALMSAQASRLTAMTRQGG
jgi:hypothetical protein